MNHNLTVAWIVIDQAAEISASMLESFLAGSVVFVVVAAGTWLVASIPTRFFSG